MRSSSLQKLVTAAALAALTCVATLILPIPSPSGGYVNLGDCFVLISGWILGPVYGFAAAGIGSALADALTGYTVYIPGTLIIKGCMALIACLLFRLLSGKKQKHPLLGHAVSGVVAECFMVVGYFIFTGWLLGKGLAAAAGIPGNLVQSALGVSGGIVLMKALSRIKFLHFYKGDSSYEH